MRTIGKTIQVALTYIGTIVGAGFATGQEILQFFSRYGWMATATIGLATVLFVWLGVKIMLLANEVGAQSYEDLNRQLFGDKAGAWISRFMLVILLGTTIVMLAGAGSLLREHVAVPTQFGLLATMMLTYLLLLKGMDAIMAVNSVVVPVMLTFNIMIMAATSGTEGAANWITLTSDYPVHQIWFSPLLYVAFNLAMAQAVLVPLGSAVENRRILIWGGILGGLGIGALLIGCHYALSAQLPGVAAYEIPMGHLIARLGRPLQLLYVAVIFSEIFTTFLGNVYGLSLQLHDYLRIPRNGIIAVVLLVCYLVGQIGFSRLLSFLYPLFGLVSLCWFVFLIGGKYWRTSKA